MPTSLSGNKGLLAITLGDPAGIGPEVALKALARLPKPALKKIILIGSEAFYAVLAKRLKLKLSRDLRFYFPYEIPQKIQYGRSDKHLTRLTVRSIETAVRLAMNGQVGAIVTPPINKAGLKKAGFNNIPGHTEFLAELSRTERFEMMLVGGKLRVVLVTRHTPIRKVAGKITKKRVEETILMTAHELKHSFGISKPRIVVCGLNPHAGEEGTIGHEDRDIISPAVKAARKKTKTEIVGPLSPDALFYDAYLGRYDAEICMYHDQGLIPLKMISRGAGVNVTLGLPFVRTSPDHGTAYDIASRFCADPGSMLEAIQLALKLTSRRRG